MTTTRRVLTLTCALALLASPADAAKGGISDQGGELYSIEKRDLVGSHELMLALGAMPMDAFFKGMTLQGSYTYHFTHLYAVEFAGLYSFNFATGLEQELKERFDVQPTKTGELLSIINVNFVLKPLYGKFAVINDKIFTGEMYFVAGYAHGFFSAAKPAGIDFGVGLRMFINKYFSLRLDIRDYMFLPEFKSVSNNLFISFGLGLTFGFSEEEKED
jgi:outer membrane beta-barrel protein